MRSNYEQIFESLSPDEQEAELLILAKIAKEQGNVRQIEPAACDRAGHRRRGVKLPILSGVFRPAR